MNTSKGSVIKQSGNNVEDCGSQKVLFQPNMRVFLQYSVNASYAMPIEKLPSKSMPKAMRRKGNI